MTLEEMKIIEEYATRGTLRDLAIKAHRRCIPLIGVRGNDHMRFMAEVDNPSPDLVLRNQYRAKVIELSQNRAKGGEE